ncbi:Defense protein l(2)34Fc [Orchesella cincta]|uniref:Defense protein l(2)34Fc n=1 Tax=Orchesella cincta TaxID=48709 RepID=A0A1D2NCX9_ORCCI|nr:Defense protein l(2)34Fc [Orchesella cincta]
MLQMKFIIFVFLIESLRGIASEYMIPEGCYGQKQLQDMRTQKTSRIKYTPKRPEWCSSTDFLVPPYLKKVTAQASKPPFIIRVYPFTNSDAHRIVIKSTDSTVKFTDVIIVARDENNDSNWGRFIRSEGVQLICCAFLDKDVARFQATGDGVNQVVFYWVPHEVTKDYHEGDIVFIATVAKNAEEYWTNLRSSPVDVTPPHSILKLVKADDMADHQRKNPSSEPYKEPAVWDVASRKKT